MLELNFLHDKIIFFIQIFFCVIVWTSTRDSARLEHPERSQFPAAPFCFQKLPGLLKFLESNSQAPTALKIPIEFGVGVAPALVKFLPLLHCRIILKVRVVAFYLESIARKTLRLHPRFVVSPASQRTKPRFEGHDA